MPESSPALHPAPGPTAHVYLRDVEAEARTFGRTSLGLLAAHIAPGARVLDVGCGSGALGAALKDGKGCVCDGITFNAQEAELAAAAYHQVHVADLETCDLDALLGEAQYDAIVCADILEHLRQPESLLAALRGKLAQGGCLLLSVPNAGYCGLVAELLHGEFRYRQEGLLDRTHLRFFTRSSLLRFLGAQGWRVESFECVERALHESEFRVAWDALPPAVARYLLAVPDALGYQFVLSARPGEPSQITLEESPGTELPREALFSAQLYMGHEGHYREEDKLSASATMGQMRQCLRFALPAHQPLGQLRLDPADRPGFLHLYRISLLSATGEALWQWQVGDPPHALLGRRSHSIVWSAPSPGAAFALSLLLAGDDPWFELPIPEETLAAGRAACLEVELGWPMSADYLALSRAVHPLQEQLHQVQQHWVKMQETFQNSVSRLTQRNAALEESVQAHSSEKAHWQKVAAHWKGENKQLAAQVQDIENSTVFRLSRPLVRAKMRLGALLPKRAQPRARLPHIPPAHPVDIIVPVYRGLEETRQCLQSVLATPAANPAWHLVVINDASPEPELAAWLRGFAAGDARITLLENEHNLGFVATVNRGMQLHPERDALLLNSDAEVSNNWLARLRAAAYADARVASVTPFSNNATICSYPRFCHDNALPPGWSLAQMDALCARTLAGQTVDVPTGVGFCMYLRRDALGAVGLFDVESFGLGYGEENDWCQRAAKAGWRNLHLLDTFVLHKGGASFGEHKSAREAAAMQTLARLHPRYEGEVAQFVAQDPALGARLQLDVARFLNEARGCPVILAVLHGLGGGTLRHVRELARCLRGRALFLGLSPAAGGRVRLGCTEEAEGFALFFRVADQWEELLDVLRQLGVAHIHFHHLLEHHAAIYDLPARLGVAWDCTAHDFYSYCKNISLSGQQGRYLPPPGLETCACCALEEDAPHPLPGSVAEWRGRNRRLLLHARHVIAPSRDTAQRIAAFAAGVDVQCVPHPDLPETLPAPRPRPLADGQPLKIAVLGALSPIKGAEVLDAVARGAMQQGLRLDFHLIGHAWRELPTRPHSHLTVYGPYEDKDLGALLDWLRPHLVWFPAQWPETYSYTLSSCLVAGLAVVAPDIGAFAERLAGRAWSWIRPWDGSTQEWLDFFCQLREQHFAPGLPPEPPPGLPAIDAQSHIQLHDGQRFYGEDYLQGITARAPAKPELPGMDVQDATFLLAHGRGQPGMGSQVRGLLERSGLWAPLRRVWQRLPHAAWRSRVSRWLRA